MLETCCAFIQMKRASSFKIYIETLNLTNAVTYFITFPPSLIQVDNVRSYRREMPIKPRLFVKNGKLL